MTISPTAGAITTELLNPAAIIKPSGPENPSTGFKEGVEGEAVVQLLRIFKFDNPGKRFFI